MLADFGLSRALEDAPSGLTTSEGLKGTLRYYSPELMNEQDASHSLASDMWAWGCLVMEVRRMRDVFTTRWILTTKIYRCWQTGYHMPRGMQIAWSWLQS